jgi:hypothetical protein
MISNTSDVPLLAGGYITLDTVKSTGAIGNRRTKIFCTMGPASWDVPELEQMIEAGMNVARFNFSHGDHEGHKACLDRLRQAAKNMNQNVGEFVFFFRRRVVVSWDVSSSWRIIYHSHLRRLFCFYFSLSLSLFFKIARRSRPPRHQGAGDTHRILRKRRDENHAEKGGQPHPDDRLRIQGRQHEARVLLREARVERQHRSIHIGSGRQPRPHGDILRRH